MPDDALPVGADAGTETAPTAGTLSAPPAPTRRRGQSGAVLHRQPTLSPPMIETILNRLEAGDPPGALAQEYGVPVGSIWRLGHQARKPMKLRQAKDEFDVEAVPVMFDGLHEIARRLQERPGSMKVKELNMVVGTLHDKVFGKPLEPAPDLLSQMAQQRWDLVELAVRLKRTKPDSQED